MQRLLTIILLSLSFTIFAKATTVPAVEVLVRLQENVTVEQFTKTISAADEPLIYLEYEKEVMAALNLHLFSFLPTLAETSDMLEKLEAHELTVEAFLNEKVESRNETPNDPNFDLQWDMRIIDAPRVWDVTTGGVTALGDTIVVAVVDEGFDVTHEDLVDNLWRNFGEIAGDGIDNDNNGYVDDIYGWNHIDNSGTFVPHFHGQSVSGIVGAQGNNLKGVTGVNWEVQMMLFQFDRVSHIFEAYEYIVQQRRLYNATNGQQGAFIVASNASWGLVQPQFCEAGSSWDALFEMLGEEGILTAGATTNTSLDIDEVGDTPSGCPTDFMISVTETTQDDIWKNNRGYGQVGVDIGAPGGGSYTVNLNNGYNEFNSNSAATPHVTGAIALLYSLPCEELARAAIEDPKATALLMREAILNGVDPLESLAGRTSTGGRLNVFNSMVQLQPFCDVQTGDLDLMRVYPNPVRGELTFTYETPDFEEYEVRIFNALGQLVYLERFEPQRFGEKLKTVDVTNLASGVYFLTVFRGNDFVQESFLVH